MARIKMRRYGTITGKSSKKKTGREGQEKRRQDKQMGKRQKVGTLIIVVAPEGGFHKKRNRPWISI